MPKKEVTEQTPSFYHDLNKLWQKLPLKTDLLHESSSDYWAKWQKWAEKFIPILITLDEAGLETVYQNLAQLSHLRIYNFLESLDEVALRADSSTEVVTQIDRFMTGLAQYFEVRRQQQHLERKNLAFYAHLNTSSLRTALRMKFQVTTESGVAGEVPFDPRDKTFLQLEIQLTSLLRLSLTDERIKTLVKILRQFREKSQPPLSDQTDLTERILKSYGDSRKVRKSLKHLHHDFPEWADTQTKQLKKKEKRK